MGARVIPAVDVRDAFRIYGSDSATVDDNAKVKDLWSEIETLL